MTIPALRSLTHAYPLTDEPQYARKAAILLARLASVYPNHDDRQDWLWAARHKCHNGHDAAPYRWTCTGQAREI